MPDDTFGSHWIKTFAILLNGRVDGSSTKTYIALHKDDDWVLGKENEISYAGIQSGTWYGNENKEKPIAITVFRGSICSSDFSDKGLPVYHSAAKSSKNWRPSVRYVNETNKDGKKAKKGDVIINRVGHSCGYWCVCDKDETLISDCIIVVQKKRGLVKCLKRISTNGKLDIQPRGVATKYITKEDIIDRITSVWGQNPA